MAVFRLDQLWLAFKPEDEQAATAQRRHQQLDQAINRLRLSQQRLHQPLLDAAARPHRIWLE